MGLKTTKSVGMVQASGEICDQVVIVVSERFISVNDYSQSLHHHPHMYAAVTYLYLSSVNYVIRVYC